MKGIERVNSIENSIESKIDSGHKVNNTKVIITKWIFPNTPRVGGVLVKLNFINTSPYLSGQRGWVGGWGGETCGVGFSNSTFSKQTD